MKVSKIINIFFQSLSEVHSECLLLQYIILAVNKQYIVFTYCRGAMAGIIKQFIISMPSHSICHKINFSLQ